MTHVDFTVMQGDRLPLLYATLSDDEGGVINLTGCTVAFRMKAESDRITKVVAGACVVDVAATGDVHYAWAALDTDTPGIYRAHFRVTDASGKLLCYPSDGYFLIEVLEDRTL